MHGLAVLLREKPVRAIFTSSGGVGLLAPLLAACTGPTHSQLAYEICLCVWQLSFHPPAVQAMSTTGEEAACCCCWLPPQARRSGSSSTGQLLG